MNFHVLTLFPQIFNGTLPHSMIGRAIDNGIVSVTCTDIRDYSSDTHGTADDYQYGGGPGMVPLLQVECVEKGGWITESEFLEVLAMSAALPGPLALKVAAYVGHKEAGLGGAAMALLGDPGDGTSRHAEPL